MDDARVWGSEEGLWLADPARYRATIDDSCLMALPAAPYLVTGTQAAEAVAATPRWTRAELTDRRVARPQEGLVVIAYAVRAERDGVPSYEAHCTTTYRRLAHEEWRVVQHQQTPTRQG